MQALSAVAFARATTWVDRFRSRLINGRPTRPPNVSAKLAFIKASNDKHLDCGSSIDDDDEDSDYLTTEDEESDEEESYEEENYRSTTDDEDFDSEYDYDSFTEDAYESD
eukprot:7234328-Prymnesium_polylepis.1